MSVHAKKAIAGSIYKGRVTRVLPGMQSAFVDLGLKRDAFLYVTDVADPAGSVGGDSDLGVIEAEPPKPLPAASRKAAAKKRKKGGSTDSVRKAAPQRPGKQVDSDGRAPRRSRAQAAEAAPHPRFRSASRHRGSGTQLPGDGNARADSGY